MVKEKVIDTEFVPDLKISKGLRKISDELELTDADCSAPFCA